MTLLPVAPAHALRPCPEERRWLIEGLWAGEAVGIVGGEPKCCKSLLALDMAVAVAGGVPCMHMFPASQTGRVLLYAAEDALHVVRQRLLGIACSFGLALEALDIQVITAPSVRLDLPQDCARLVETVEKLRPRLLVLDPFVRLHRIDENVSGEVAPVLAYLRELQRRFALAVVVVHHAKKGAGRERGGQALRGSSEFHAWGDSNLYLRRLGEELILSIEHRASPSSGGLSLRLEVNGEAMALRVADERIKNERDARLSPREIVERALEKASGPISVTELRDTCRIRTARVCDALAELTNEGRVCRTASGYEITRRPAS